MSGNHRFSPAEFAAEVSRESDMARKPGDVNEKRDRVGEWNQEEEFVRLADEVRSFLSTPRGATGEERRQYGETLNRAVLGFPQERAQLLAVIQDRLQAMRIHDGSEWRHPYATLAEALFAEVVGLNVLELMLAEKSGLEEIQVVGTRIYEVRRGQARVSRYAFGSMREVERIQQNLVLYNNDRISPRKRWAEVMLQDGSRVTMTGFGFTSQPTLTIRFYTVQSFSLEALSRPECGTLNPEMAELLKAVLKARFNLVIIGPTNSGKTSLMKALIAELPATERIVTIESRFEMMLGRDFPDKNIVEYEASEDDVGHSSSQAFKLALRQSPERIICAEIRDDDANIYVRACTRGHTGSMTTVHANQLEDVPEAVTDMCMLDGRAMNPERLAKRISEYVTEVGIEMRMVAGRRVLGRIGELSWTNGETKVKDWYRLDDEGRGWVRGSAPSIRAASRLEAAGYKL